MNYSLPSVLKIWNLTLFSELIAKKVIVSKFKFYVLQLLESTPLFAVMA